MKTLRSLSLIGLIGVSFTIHAQNVGINATGAAPVSSAALDVDMTNKGMLIPRVALTNLSTFAPVTGTATASLLVYNTATFAGASPGYYYWSGSQWLRMITTEEAWRVGASATDVNNPIATGSFGTTSNQHIDLVTNGLVRGRLSNLGEFFIGTTTTALPGDLMNSVSNATFPWALNGYSTQDGSGVYGAVQSGTTIYAGVQGEYYGTNAQGAGVRGLLGNTTAGTSFAAQISGVQGDAITAGTYKFGVYGNGGTSLRSGGVMGNDYGIRGALGYYANSGFDYSVYGFGTAYFTGIAAGIITNPNANSTTTFNNKSLTTQNIGANAHIGLGIYGGVMGGWVRGLVYGTHLKGERYSLYVDGKTYVNEPITQILTTDSGEKKPTYAPTAMRAEVSDRGKSNLENGQRYVAFDENFKTIVSPNIEELTITVSPLGNSNGIYIESITADGFIVRENNNGNSTVQFSWIAIGTQKGFETITHSPELLEEDFDQKMNGVMFNENNNTDLPQTMWWDGTQIRWDAPPAKDNSDAALELQKIARPMPAPATSQPTIVE